MIQSQELLYSVFERNLFVLTLHHEDVGTFVQNVIEDYLSRLMSQGMIVPFKMRKVLEDDLRDEVLEMTRKKIYGYTSIEEYRRQNQEVIERYLRKTA